MGNSQIDIHFSDYFKVNKSLLEKANAFDVSLINDLPLFVDPFLLFNSDKEEYKELHKAIIKYVSFLRDKAVAGKITAGLLRAWFTFPEVKQTWLGYSVVGNDGRGLGLEFAESMRKNLRTVFSNFGRNDVTKGSHIEKLTLIEEGVGKDNISDFTTNLIKAYLLEFTQGISREIIAPELLGTFVIPKVSFNYKTETWMSQKFELPKFEDDFVILCPRDILTREEPWINKEDLLDNFQGIAASITNEQLRHQVNNYFIKALPVRPRRKESRAAAARTISRYPQVIDYYILGKEENASGASIQSERRVSAAETLFGAHVQKLAQSLLKNTDFYSITGNTFEEAKQRVEYLKTFIEDQGGHRLFYLDGRPVRKESDLHLMYRLTWFGSESTVTREANDGRGPVDFKISKSSSDVSLVEFKLASNSQLRRNLANQTRIYKKASGAKKAITVILYFSEAELMKVQQILKDLDRSGDRSIILIDCRNDNKPSGSKA